MYNVLIIGAGGQGAFADGIGTGNEHKIISFSHAFKQHEGFNCIFLYDIDFEKAKKAANIWGINAIYDYFEIMYLIDIVIITTPDDTHYDILKDIINYKPKLVICEKPLCNKLERAQEIVNLYKENNVPLMVNYTRRFLPYYQELKRLYDLGILGEIKECKLLFNRGWEHTATHGIDLFNWFFGNKINPKIQYAGHESYRVWSISMEFEKYYWNEIRYGMSPVWGYYDFSHWYIAENAYNFLEGKEELMCNGDDALKALEICFKLMGESNINEQ